MTGRVLWFSRQRGCGFIEGEDRVRYFVHITELTDRRPLQTGERVTFDVTADPRGPRAAGVCRCAAEEVSP